MKGMALVVVLVIVTMLVLVATPFVASMILQERSSVQIALATQAEFDVQSAANFAVHQLLGTHEAYERPRDGHEWDSLEEIQVRSKLPGGRRWGIHVEDEQGKIMLVGLPRHVLAAVHRFPNPPRFTTRYAVRPARWIGPQRVRSVEGNGVRVDDPSLFGPGAKVRITSPALDKPHYGESLGVREGIVFLSSLPDAPNPIMEVEARAPINVNTAPREALACVFSGLSLRVATSDGGEFAIDDRTALRAADEIIGERPFRSMEDLERSVLRCAGLSPAQKQAVIINATRPTAIELDGTGTLPFVFRSFDVFTILSSCESRSRRDVVELTPPMPVVHVFDEARGNRFEATERGIEIRSAKEERGVGPGGLILTRDHALRDLPARFRWDQVLQESADADISAGGAMFWVRLSDGGSLLNVRESDWSNRLSVESRNGELVLAAADESGAGLSRIRMPFHPRANVWYHIGAFWKTTGQLAIMVDGFSNAQTVHEFVDANERLLGTRLAAPLVAPDAEHDTMEVLLEDDAWVADRWSPLKIGSEVILYDKQSKRAIRGVRGTKGYAHPAGVRVLPFGYSQALRSLSVDPTRIGASDVPSGYRVQIDGLDRGSGRLLSRIGPDTSCGLARSIDSSAQTVAAIGELQTQFPPKGYLRIEDELVRYEGFTTARVKIPEDDPLAKTVEVEAFQIVERGARGTTAAGHPQFSGLHLASLPLADARPGFVQIDKEWFGPLIRDPRDPSMFVTPTDDGRAHALMRGIGGTGISSHSAGTAVLPLFVVQGRGAGRGDSITLTDREMRRCAVRIRCASSYDEDHQLLGLDSPAPQDYRPDRPYTRILKFPSGELLSRAFLETSPEVALEASGTIDEITFFAMSDNSAQTTSWSDSSMGIQSSDPLEPWGGVVKIGEEYIGYAEYASERISKLTRGYLNSPVEVHDEGDSVFVLPFLPVSTLDGAHDAATSKFRLRRQIASGIEGCVWIDGEVAFYTEKDSLTLSMPERLRQKQGLYRGRFGTTPSAHEDQSLVYAIPYRYYDTYEPREFDSSMAFADYSTSIPNAHWNDLRWSGETPPGTRVHVLTRIDGRGEFFDDPREFTSIHGSKAFEAELQVRLLFEYQQGCFFPSDGWKSTPRVDRLEARYERAWQVLMHSEK